MAVMPRKRKGGVVYGVLTSWSGGKHWELVGKNKREAEQLDRQRLREVAAGTFRPGQLTDAASVKAFAESWLERRENRSAENDRALVRRHVLGVASFASLRMADVRPRDVLALIKTLQAGDLAPKSVALVMGIVRVMFRDAVIDDVISATPYVVARGVLTRAGEKRTPYTRAEGALLVSEAVPERERLWNAIALYTGARCGEVCGLTWGDWDAAPEPLGALRIERQYGGQVLKTERPRVAPVHPELAARLTAWRDRWPLYFLRRPGPTDLICPRLIGNGPDVEHLTKSAAYKAWLRSCKAAGVTNRSVHSTRHTFITLARRGGADKELVELVTHNPKGTIVDVYTTRDWSELCDAVLCVSFDAPVDTGSNGSGNSGSSAWTRSRANPEDVRETEESSGTERTPGARISRGGADSDARVDARRTELRLALEAHAAIYGGRVPESEPVPVQSATRRGKAVRDAS